MVSIACHKRSDPALLRSESLCLVSWVKKSSACPGGSGVQPEEPRGGKNLDTSNRHFCSRKHRPPSRKHDIPLRLRQHFGEYIARF